MSSEKCPKIEAPYVGHGYYTRHHTMQEIADQEDIKLVMEFFKYLRKRVRGWKWRINQYGASTFCFTAFDFYLTDEQVSEMREYFADYSFGLKIGNSELTYRLSLPKGASVKKVITIIKALRDGHPEEIAAADDKLRAAKDKRSATTLSNQAASDKLFYALVDAFPQHDLKNKLELHGNIIELSITRCERYMNQWQGYRSNEAGWDKQCKMFEDVQAWCDEHDVEYDLDSSERSTNTATSFTKYLKMKATSFMEQNMKKINENTKVTLTFGQIKRLVKESAEATDSLKDIAAFASKAMFFSVLVHFWHLNCGSNAQHLALKDLYESLDDNADKLLEAVIGQIGESVNITNPGFEFKGEFTEESIEQVKAIKDEASKLEATVEGNPGIANVLADIVEDCDSAIYKLKRLK